MGLKDFFMRDIMRNTHCGLLYLKFTFFYFYHVKLHLRNLQTIPAAQTIYNSSERYFSPIAE